MHEARSVDAAAFLLLAVNTGQQRGAPLTTILLDGAELPDRLDVGHRHAAGHILRQPTPP
jgi:hypothetical protein